MSLQGQGNFPRSNDSGCWATIALGITPTFLVWSDVSQPSSISRTLGCWLGRYLLSIGSESHRIFCWFWSVDKLARRTVNWLPTGFYSTYAEQSSFILYWASLIEFLPLAQLNNTIDWRMLTDGGVSAVSRRHSLVVFSPDETSCRGVVLTGSDIFRIAPYIKNRN